MSAQERDLIVRTNAAAMRLDSDEDKFALFQQRQVFEDILKISANSLSNKFEAQTLVKLLRICAFLENKSDLVTKLLDLMKSKVNHLENYELSQILQSLVLLSPQDPKFIKNIEMLIMRRIHSFEIKEIAHIIKAYSLLYQQRKMDLPSFTFV